MKSIYSAVFGASLLFSSVAIADVQLQLPGEVKVLVVNCVKEERVKQVTLEDGENQLVFRLITELGPTNDEDMYYSKVFVTRFNAAAGSYTMQIPPISRSNDIRKFNENPDIAIVDGKKSRINLEVAPLEKDGIQVFRNFEEEVRMFNQTESPAAFTCAQMDQEASTPAPSVQESKVQPSEESVKKDSTSDGSMETAEKMLNYWYDQADEETRKRFKESLK